MSRIALELSRIGKELPYSWLSGKESTCCNVGDASLIPGSGRSC